MEVLYRSTRGNEESVSASKAILEGLASDGGLFVPQALPSFDKTLDEFAQMDYRQTAYEVMKLLLTDFTEEELRYCIDKAYDGKFDTEAIAPLAEVKNAWYLELFHGPTIAFKDMALSILPYLMTTAAKKNQIKNEIVILTATSGDTGKAALAGFADVPGTRIMVFYPKDGVSPIQEKQMVTQTGANTRVIGIHGNFDDAQSGVKKLFADKELAAWMEERGYQFSSANSINIGRLVPQICYYVYAYALMGRYENTVINTLRNSFTISLRYFKKTILIFLVVAFEILLFVWSGTTEFIGLIIGPVCIMFTISGMAKPIFLRIEKDNSGSDDEEEETEEDVDVSEYETIDYEKLAQRAKKNE